MVVNCCILLIVFAFIISSRKSITSTNRILYHNQKPRVLITSLFYNSAKHVNRFFELVNNISYPKSLISLGLLEGDSSDDTTALIQKNINKLNNTYNRITFIHKNVKSYIPNSFIRYFYFLQKRRRSKLAILRNYLINSTLKDEEYVLCIDSDVTKYRKDILKLLLKVNEDVVVPTCRCERSKNMYDLNTWIIIPSIKEYINTQKKDYLLQQPYRHKPAKYLPHLGTMHKRYKNRGLLYPVRVDGIGGTMALIKSKVFHSGVIFPEKLYKHCLETEGFGLMANDYNFSVVAVPNVDIYHSE